MSYLRQQRAEYLQRRDDKIVAAYLAGDRVDFICRRWQVPQGYVTKIVRQRGYDIRRPRKQRPGVALTSYMPAQTLNKLSIAAQARKMSVADLVARLSDCAASDFSLLDNILDDDVQTQVAA